MDIWEGIKSWFRKIAVDGLMLDAQEGRDISAAVPTLTKVLSDERMVVRSHAADALKYAARNGVDISVAIPALAKALSDECELVRWGAALALWEAADNGTDVSAAVPALVKALSDEDKGVRKTVLLALMDVDIKEIDASLINLEEIKNTLRELVENWGKDTRERKLAERKASEGYVKIAKSVSRTKKSIGMDSPMLDGTIKPPSDKGKVYRERVLSGNRTIHI